MGGEHPAHHSARSTPGCPIHLQHSLAVHVQQRLVLHLLP